MRGAVASGRFWLFTVLTLVAALALAGIWLGAMVESAGAALPGKNSRIAFTSNRVTADNPTVILISTR
jgi:hypothetical protein